MAKKESVSIHVEHPFPPLFDSRSKVLILGSFPSVKSREGLFFYHHPQNRFWKVLAAVFQEETPDSIPEKRTFILSHHLALWDVIASCDLIGSSDASIRNAVPNDLSAILEGSSVKKIITNGKTSSSLYRKYIEPVTGIPDICCPSTSPANAAWTLEKLTLAWKDALVDL